MRIKWDSVAGWILGLVFCLVVGKCWLVTDMTVVEILKVIVESQVGWSW